MKMRSLLAAGAVALAVAAPRPALAQGAGPSAGDRAAADALFDAAKKLADEGKHADACPKFEDSYNLDKTLGTLLNLADCHEKVGKIARAWAEWGEAEDRARRANDERSAYAKERRDALTPRLPKLEVKVTNPRPGLTVHRDGTPIGEGSFGLALPVDPGKHVIAVKRGEEVLVEKTVDTAEGKTAAVALDLAAIEEAAPAPAPATTALPPKGGGGAGPLAPVAGKYEARRNIGLVIGGAGVAALIGAGVVGALAIGAKPEEGACIGARCLPDAVEDQKKAKTFADISTIVGIAGIAAIGTGVALLVSIPSSGKAQGPARPTLTARRAWVSPWAGPAGGGVAVGGAL